MSDDAVLTADQVTKCFRLTRRGGLWRSATTIRAVDGINLELHRGEGLALVGESGCGKSTLASLLVGLTLPTEGRVLFGGQDLARLDRAGSKAARRQLQMIFQDPYESLNPRETVGQIVSEPLLIHGLGPPDPGHADRVTAALELAGLTPSDYYASRLPQALSGGQRQRVAIAAALVLEPAVLVADEPVSMLDVSIRAEILHLMTRLRQERHIAVLYILHDLAVAGSVADRVAVMYLGRLVELGPAAKVLVEPRHPYTQALLAAAPIPRPGGRQRPPPLPAEAADAAELPAGCRFHPRCPAAVMECRHQAPNWHQVGPGHGIECLRPDRAR